MGWHQIGQAAPNSLTDRREMRVSAFPCTVVVLRRLGKRIPAAQLLRAAAPPHFDWQHGRSLFQQAKKLKLEGLVAKRLGSVYRPGERTEDWQKVKVPGAVPAERFKRS